MKTLKFKGTQVGWLKSQCALYRGLELCLWSFHACFSRSVALPAHSPRPSLLPCLPLVLTRFVPFSRLPPSAPCLWPGSQGILGPCPGCRDRCLDHDPPLANRSFAFNFRYTWIPFLALLSGCANLNNQSTSLRQFPHLLNKSDRAVFSLL